jgi:sialate O-acetylesterase
VNLTNVLFGDVILCSGQSNMQFTVNAVFNATEALQAAGNYSTIRVFTVGQSTTSSTPLNELATIEQAWSVATSASIGEGAAAFSYFSAVCWFTAVNIQKYYPDLPLGLVSSNWGGTIIQAWSSPIALAECPQTASSTLTVYDKVAQSPDLYADQKYESGPSANSDSVLWNAMIVPFLQMKLAAFLWYQAEANVGQTDLYRCLFPAMINDWRVNWGLGDTPFFFAQLAPYTTDGPLPEPWSLADMRLAQTSGLSLPNVGMISTIDLGDTGSPFTNIHPRDKQDVGYRMGLAANSILYGVPYVVHSGPTLSSATIVSNYPNVQIILNFLPNTIGSGLNFRTASCPSGIPTTLCSTWEIGLSDGSWHNATAAITQTYAVQLEFTGNTTSGPTVAATRYLYNNWPVATLYNNDGLPANPFYFTFVE